MEQSTSDNTIIDFDDIITNLIDKNRKLIDTLIEAEKDLISFINKEEDK